MSKNPNLKSNNNDDEEDIEEEDNNDIDNDYGDDLMTRHCEVVAA